METNMTDEEENVRRDRPILETPDARGVPHNISRADFEMLWNDTQEMKMRMNNTPTDGQFTAFRSFVLHHLGSVKFASFCGLVFSAIALGVSIGTAIMVRGH